MYTNWSPIVLLSIQIVPVAGDTPQRPCRSVAREMTTIKRRIRLLQSRIVSSFLRPWLQDECSQGSIVYSDPCRVLPAPSEPTDLSYGGTGDRTPFLGV